MPHGAAHTRKPWSTIGNCSSFSLVNPEALCNLGVALFSLGRYEEAEQCYRQSLEINPMSSETLCNLAAVLQGNRRKPRNIYGAP